MECIACVFFAKYDILGFMYPIRPQCHHPKPPTFTISKFWLTVNILLVIILMCCGISSSVYLSTVCPQEKSLCFLMISDQLVFFGNALVILLLLVKIKTQLREFTSWSLFFEHMHSYNLVRVFTSYNIRRSNITRLLSTFVPSSFHVFISYYYLFSYDHLPMSFLRKSFLCVCYIMQTRRVYDMNKIILTSGLVLRQFGQSLKENLTNRPNRFVDVCRKYHKLVSHLNTNIALFMETTKYVLYVWLFVGVVTLILNFYLMINYDDFGVYTSFVLQVRTANVIAALWVFSLYTEKFINRKVSQKSINQLSIRIPSEMKCS
ncbi:hypothetical protein Zmor_008204 [Zophobas morio]|uniref:Uncharacterized protein n=1 Tax=Zophobas morio TaxID=2755281 RepID=A0AA38MQ43_9CUCU|nr:hypothetical protein Zmor_008204 [Zophobas morio]